MQGHSQESYLKYKEGSKRQYSGIQMYVTTMLHFCISALKRMGKVYV